MARNPVSSLAHAYLGAFSELLHKHAPESAVAKFSKLVAGKKLDAISSNALYFITHPASGKNLKEELLSRANQAKNVIDQCTSQMSDFAKERMASKTVVVHPLSTFSARLLRDAKEVRFTNADNEAIKLLPETDMAVHHPLTSYTALENADLVLLEPSAITSKGVFVERGGRILAELARARGMPVYALATSWHTSPNWKPGQTDEHVPQEFLTGIISEHGIYEHNEFLAKVQKAFPWML
jgi:translation initiation factor 2B subunit (eIF-2B alpha/beta/delta family)